MSKKIVFVQKEEGSYDPVMAFFNKKQTPGFKNANQTTKPVSAAKNTSTAKPNEKPSLTWKGNSEKNTSNQVKQPVQTSKTSKTQAGIGSKPYPPKQQVLKARDLSKANPKRQSQTNLFPTPMTKEVKEEEKAQPELKEDSLEKMTQDELPKRADKNETQKPSQKKDEFSKKIGQLQAREQEYIRRIEEFQAKEEKYLKNEQKLQKLQKEFKAAVQKSKQAEGAMQKLKDKQQQIKDMLEGKSIPFSRKREVILCNKLKELKRANRQLVLRLKSYKGTDLVELSMQQNREEIMKDLYTVDVEKQLKEEMNVEMESLASQLAQKIDQYIQRRIKEKGQRVEWGQQHSWLLEVMQLSEKISLNYLQKYQIAPMPQSNQEAQSAYSILEEYTKSNQMQKIVDRFNLNLALSKDNLSVIEYLQQSNDQMISIKKEVGLSQRKKQMDKSRLKHYLASLQKRANFQEIIVIHSICQVQLTKEWLEKVHTQVNQELSSLSKALGEIRDIVAVGESAKDSLYYYLSNNLEAILPKLPTIKHSLKQIRADFDQLQRLCQATQLTK